MLVVRNISQYWAIVSNRNFALFVLYLLFDFKVNLKLVKITVPLSRHLVFFACCFMECHIFEN